MTPRLAAQLVRRDLIRPDPPQLIGEDGFRFRHILIRDAAYEALPKAVPGPSSALRSLAGAARDRLVELDDILGYLEQACSYRMELGMARDDESAVPRRRAASDGRRSPRGARRQDYGAAVSLFERAAGLLLPDEIDLALETELGDALLWAEQGRRRAQALDALSANKACLGRGRSCRRAVREDPGKVCFASTSIQRAHWRNWPRWSREALPVFEAAGDELALFIGYDARGGR